MNSIIIFILDKTFVHSFGFLGAMSGVSVGVRTQCEWHAIGCEAVRTPNIFSDKHTSTREAIKMLPSNLSE